MCKVTVVVPTYNRLAYLLECIHSLLEQTIHNFEIFIIDDGSTDGTEAFARQHADGRIRYFRNKQNMGQLNIAKEMLEIAYEYGKGEYIFVLADDDKLKPQALEYYSKVMDEHVDVGVVITNFDKIDQNGVVIQENCLFLAEDVCLSRYEFIKQSFYNWNYYGLMCPMLRAEFGKKYNVSFHPEIGFRFEISFYCEVNLFGDIFVLKNPLAYHRVHVGQESGKFRDFGETDFLHFQYLYNLIIQNGANELISMLKGVASTKLLWTLIRDNGDKAFFSSKDMLKVRGNLLWEEALSIADPLIIIFLYFNLLFQHADDYAANSKITQYRKTLTSETNMLYHQWLNRLLTGGKGVTHVLKSNAIDSIVIHGSTLLGYLLLKDAEMEDIDVSIFLDNDVKRQGNFLGGKGIRSPKWLEKGKNEIRAVVIAVEGSHDMEIKKQLGEIIGESDVRIVSWKELF